MFSFSNTVQRLATNSDEIICNFIDGLINFERNHEKSIEREKGRR